MQAASQEARAGAERRRWFAAASAAVERRQASASRWTCAAPPPLSSPQAGEDEGCGCGGGHTRLSAFRLPDFYAPGAIEMDAGTPAGAIRRDRVGAFRFPWSKTRVRTRRENAFLVIASASEQSSAVRGVGLLRRGAWHRAGHFGPDPLAPSQWRTPMRNERASLHPLAAAFSQAGAPSRIDGERSPVAGQFERWSGRRDSNPDPNLGKVVLYPELHPHPQEGKAAAAATKLCQRAAGLATAAAAA